MASAATPTTLSDINDIAKDYYTNVYVRAYNPKTPLRSSLGRFAKYKYTGRKMIFAVKTLVGGGSANVGAAKALPAARAGTYDQGETTPVRTYTRMAMDGLAIKATDSEAGAFAEALTDTMRDRLEAHDYEVNRQLYCAGDGKLFGITTGAASTTQTPGVGTGGAVGDYGVANGGPGIKHVYVGDSLRFYDNAGALIDATPRTVTSVNYSAGTFVLDSTITTISAGWASRANDDGTSSTDNSVAGEADGLLKSVSASGTLHAIPADTPAWKAISYTNGGTLRDISDTLVMQVVENIRLRCGDLPNLGVAPTGVVLKYTELFLPIRRVNGQDIQLVGGYKPMVSIQTRGQEIPVIDDPDCPNFRMFFLNTEYMGISDLAETGWINDDGATFDRVVGMDAIEGAIRKYWNVLTTKRCAMGLLGDLNDVPTLSRVS